MISVGNITPADASTVEPAGTLTFDVVSTAGLLRVLVCVGFADTERAPELVHDGDAFQAKYGASSRTAIASGYRFVLRRDGGWLKAPRPLIFAFDLVGQEL